MPDYAVGWTLGCLRMLFGPGQMTNFRQYAKHNERVINIPAGLTNSSCNFHSTLVISISQLAEERMLMLIQIVLLLNVYLVKGLQLFYVLVSQLRYISRPQLSNQNPLINGARHCYRLHSRGSPSTIIVKSSVFSQQFDKFAHGPVKSNYRHSQAGSTGHVCNSRPSISFPNQHSIKCLGAMSHVLCTFIPHDHVQKFVVCFGPKTKSMPLIRQFCCTCPGA